MEAVSTKGGVMFQAWQCFYPHGTLGFPQADGDCWVLVEDAEKYLFAKWLAVCGSGDTDTIPARSEWREVTSLQRWELWAWSIRYQRLVRTAWWVESCNVLMGVIPS